MTNLKLSSSGNGKPLVEIDGVRDWRDVGGPFDAVRLVGNDSRHPGDWGDRRAETFGVVGVHHPQSGAARKAK